MEVSSEIANEDVISILDNIVKRAELGDLNDLRGLNKILASNKDLKDLGKDFLRWLDYENKEKGRIKTPKDPGARELRTQGHNFPAGYLVTDVSDRARFLTVEDYSLVIAGLVGSLADYKAQIRLDAFMTKAKLALSRGDLLEAEESYLHALGAAKEHAQAEILVLLKLATFYKDADIFDKAVDVYMQALSCSQRYYSKDSVNNFTILNSLAVLYGGRRRFEDAAALYRRSLAGLLKLEGPEHPDTLTTTQDLANMDQKLGHYRAAIALFEKAHAGFEKSSGSNDRMTLLTLSNLAAVYQSMGMHKKSRLLLEPAISRFRQALGLSDKLTISAACNLLPCCESSNIPDDTLAIFDCCRQTRDAFSLEALQCLGDFHAKHGLIENAAEMYKLVFEGRREVLGDTNPETLNALHVKASCSMRLDFLDEAKELFQLLLRLAQSISGPESQRWRRICSDALDNLRERQDALDNEAKSWGLGRLESCTATGCNQMTIRLCSGLSPILQNLGTLFIC